MKKRSTWIVFLAALLCLTMLFVSCKSNADTDDTDDIETTDPTDTTEPQETEEPEEGKVKNEDVDYDGMIAKWAQYLTYKAPEAKPEVYDMTIATDMVGALDRSGDLGFFTEIKYGYDYLRDSEYSYNVYSVYNLVSGEKLFSAQSSALNAQSQNLSIYNYAVNELANGALFYVVKNEMHYDTIEMRYGDPVYTYAYYNAQGDLLHTCEKPEQDACHIAHSEDEYTFLTIEDQCYVCRDSQLVTTFAATEMRGIPEMTHEYNGKYYSIDDSTVWVFDENYDELVSYKLESGWDYNESCLLADGNLFVQYMWYCTSDQQDYNVETTSGGKALVKQVIVNVTDGSVTELTPAFFVASLISNAEENDRCVTLNGDYQLAMVYKIGEDKMISNDPSFVILNNDMTIKEELPAVLKNQCDLIIGHDADTFKIPAYVEDLEERNYLINKNTGELSLYTAPSTYEYDLIEGGFVYNHILYNEDLVELMDLRYVEDYDIVDGVLFVKQKDADDTWCVVYVKNGEYVCSNAIYMPYGVPSSVGEYFIVSVDDGMTNTYNVYNAYGTLLLNCNSTLSEDSNVSEGTLLSTYRTETVNFGAYNQREVTYYTYYIIK